MRTIASTFNSMKSKIFEPFSKYLFHEFFDRSINVRGDAHKSSEKIAEKISVPFLRLLFANQTHSKNVFTLKKNDPFPVSPIENIDAFVTNRDDVFLMIRSADCQAILIFDPVNRTVAAVHSGWRGSVQNVLREAIAVMCDEFGSLANDLYVAISPSIGPCCQVFSDPFSELPREFHSFILPGNFVDFWAVTDSQLREAGIPESHIENPRICTSCHTDQYFSYRKEGGETGRFASVIGLYAIIAP